MGNGYYYALNHLSEWGVKKGDKVTAGQVVAKSGNTGNSRGPHLEIEVYEGSPKYGNQIDPIAFLGLSGGEGNKVVYAPDTSNYKSQGSGGGSSGGGYSTGSGSSSHNLSAATIYKSNDYRNDRTSVQNTHNAQNLNQVNFYAPNTYKPINATSANMAAVMPQVKQKTKSVAYVGQGENGNYIVVNNGDGTYTEYTNLPNMEIAEGETVTDELLSVLEEYAEEIKSYNNNDLIN